MALGNATSWNLTELTIFEQKLCKTKLGQRNDLQSMGRPGRFLGHSFRTVLDRHGMLHKRNRTGSACCRGCSRTRKEASMSNTDIDLTNVLCYETTFMLYPSTLMPQKTERHIWE